MKVRVKTDLDSNPAELFSTNLTLGKCLSNPALSFLIGKTGIIIEHSVKGAP